MVSREKSRDGFPVGLEVNRDFPEAYLDVQKLSEEAPWKRISCHGKCRTCHKTLLEEETQSYSQYQAAPIEPTVQMLPPWNMCEGVGWVVGARLDAARLRRSEEASRRLWCVQGRSDNTGGHFLKGSPQPFQHYSAVAWSCKAAVLNVVKAATHFILIIFACIFSISTWILISWWQTTSFSYDLTA